MEVPAAVDGCCNFIIVACNVSAAVCKAAADQGVFIQGMEGGFRIAVRSGPENDRIVSVIKQLFVSWFKDQIY